MPLGFIVKVLSSRVKVVRVDECFWIARIPLQSNVNPNLFNLNPRRRLTQACDKMMFTKNGEQNGELTSPDFIAAIKRSLSIQFRTTWSHVNHKDIKWDTKPSSVVTSVHGLADSSNNGISVNRSIFITFREFMSDIEENACISTWTLLDGIGLIDDAEDDGAPQLDDSGADVDIGSDNPSIRLLTATRISSRDALLRIKASSCVDWYPSSRNASINPNNKCRSCSRSSTFRLRANLRRPSVSSLISQKREFSWQFLQGLEPIHYFFHKRQTRIGRWRVTISSLESLWIRIKQENWQKNSKCSANLDFAFLTFVACARCVFRSDSSWHCGLTAFTIRIVTPWGWHQMV